MNVIIGELVGLGKCFVIGWFVDPYVLIFCSSKFQEPFALQGFTLNDAHIPYEFIFRRLREQPLLVHTSA